jgi:hypothetical protein
MPHQTLRSETAIITTIVNRARNLGFNLAMADEDGLLPSHSCHLPKALAAVGKTEVTRLTVLEPHPSRY